MIKYLVIKILALVLFGVAFVLIPFALPFAILIAVLSGAISMISHSGDAGVGAKEAFFLFVGGLVAFFGSFKILNIYSSEHGSFILMAVFCAVTIYGGWFCRSFVAQENANFYMDDRINKLTKPHPYLLMAAGIIRLIIEAAFEFFSDQVGPYASYLNIGIGLGMFLFAVAIVMYIVRTIHVFQQNR